MPSHTPLAPMQRFQTVAEGSLAVNPCTPWEEVQSKAGFSMLTVKCIGMWLRASKPFISHLPT